MAQIFNSFISGVDAGNQQREQRDRRSALDEAGRLVQVVHAIGPAAIERQETITPPQTCLIRRPAWDDARIADAQGRKVLFAPLPDALAGLIATLTGWLPGAPLTRQQWLLLKAGNVVSGTLPGIAALGVTARPLGLFLDRWMVRYRKHGRFGSKAAA